jgi:hypothetical protein
MKEIFRVLIALSLITLFHAQSCVEEISAVKSDAEAKEIIKGKIRLNEELNSECLELLIKRAYFNSAYVLIEDYFLENNISKGRPFCFHCIT